ncbi:hypothetical protein CLOSYM_04424 [[Clostridium] symbiosum ATCC 14940]|uniref:Uncharacterized protein n=1 Tax=[Clostridium] symbiosum ATCC 14940 TaxID=411472 RepID=A0ABC9TRJ3_CLOSY|nr:hypothetical protein CLOSYM_04424 [[Clostridium] symbiosum ATCC 14940]
MVISSFVHFRRSIGIYPLSSLLLHTVILSCFIIYDNQLCFPFYFICLSFNALVHLKFSLSFPP